MGMKRICLVIVCILALLSSCTTFNTASIDLSDIPLADLVASGVAAYYLGEDGTLYSPGADSDAGAFVHYQNAKEGIVARNVTYFTEIMGGGAYINQHNHLYIWNLKNNDLWGYRQAPTHQKILEDIRYVDSCTRCLLYIDTRGDLYILGEYKDIENSIDQPMLLGHHVQYAAIGSAFVLWITEDGYFHSYGELDSGSLTKLNQQFAGHSIEGIAIYEENILVLSNQSLWLFGDYCWFLSGTKSLTPQLICLQENIRSFSLAYRTIGAVDINGNIWLWGRCISNDESQTKRPVYRYYEKKYLPANAIKIYVSDSTICYIDHYGASNIYHDGTWTSFYGNSTKDQCVGIERMPVRWE